MGVLYAIKSVLGIWIWPSVYGSGLCVWGGGEGGMGKQIGVGACVPSCIRRKGREHQ